MKTKATTGRKRISKEQKAKQRSIYLYDVELHLLEAFKAQIQDFRASKAANAPKWKFR